ncbi:HAD hydrolase-like protein [Kiloniella majae]|uniref:HAD hydrolase-like protein n=1 Tax=Kiloniella majae TaxID=1938558 RepID=UPI001C3FD9AF|nr:HAD hydrolase-like protein [Kiloniella majae]
MTVIFFDLDGTLTDPKEGITKSIQYALRGLGAESPSSDDLEWCIGPPLKESFDYLLGSLL